MFCFAIGCFLVIRNQTISLWYSGSVQTIPGIGSKAMTPVLCVHIWKRNFGILRLPIRNMKTSSTSVAYTKPWSIPTNFWGSSTSQGCGWHPGNVLPSSIQWVKRWKTFQSVLALLTTWSIHDGNSNQSFTSLVNSVMNYNVMLKLEDPASTH